MNEIILKALIQLFALVIDIDKSELIASRKRKFVESFLSNLLNKDLIQKYLTLFDDYLEQYTGDTADVSVRKKRKRVMLDAMKVMAICEEINQELEQKQKTFVLLKLLEFISLDEKVSEQELDFVLSVSSAFNISETEYQNCKNFVFGSIPNIPEKPQILVISSENHKSVEGIQTKHLEDLTGEIIFLHITSTNTFAFRYTGNQNIYLNGQIIAPHQIYTFETGSSIRSITGKTVYYTDVAKVFMKLSEEANISLSAYDIVFKFKNSENGVRAKSLSINSGQLAGVMGASGAGKSTFLNILNGNLKPQEGKVLINGHDLYDDSNKELMSGVIGFVPQDDILFEELTVLQNLDFNSQLCLNNFTDEKRNEFVEKILYDLDLYDIKDLVVGNVLNKFISGGQRKRLNIALELIREPSVLFVDEPTSGLSSVDSEIVMSLLKELTLKGKIVVVNIHQPSSDIYKMFDKMLFFDKGGYLIFSGNPIDAISYFKSKSHYINAEEEQCFECGSVNPEQLLQIIEARIVNEYGKLTRTRKISPKEWFDLYNKSRKSPDEKYNVKRRLPQSLYSIPGKLKQFRIFLSRDILSKLANKQYLLISLLEAPVLAFFLGYFTKYISGKAGNPDIYIFRENLNLPAFIFMAVVVALFIGLSISAEELIKDRKHLQRESFLGLNRNSYLHSKIGLLFIISAIQMITFVLIGTLILEIKGMTFQYWLVLFSTACFANMLGLNISSALNSVITIYILIPFILVPELLFSGVIVKYDKLHKSMSSPVYVPVIGDLMTSRWAYEALVVYQFKSNEFQKHFFDINKDLSTASYYNDYVLPEVQKSLSYCEMNYGNASLEQDINKNLALIKNEIEKLEWVTGIPFKMFEQLKANEINPLLIKESEAYLSQVKKVFKTTKSEAYKRSDKKHSDLINTLSGEEAFNNLRLQHHNKRISDLVINREGIDKIIRLDNRLVQLKDPIYKTPDSKYGRAHFYAASKRLGNREIDTFWFNLGFIWLTTIFLYLALRGNLLRKLVGNFGK